jgi:stage V sporulation protein D (sporulation-specific penicillin-binding protein)
MWRVFVIFCLILGIFAVIIARLFYWQIVKGDDLRLQASAQYDEELLLPASRGAIKASDGQPLAINVPSYLVYAEPNRIQNPDQFSRLVSPILSLDDKVVLTAVSAKDRYWVSLAKKVDQTSVNSLQVLKLTGLGFETESNRYYPESSMAAQLLGFVGSDAKGADQGYFGLEGFYDRELRGADGRLQIERDVQGAPIIIGEAKRIDPQNGRTLSLWVDRTIQHIAETQLSEGIALYGAKEGSVTIMDSKTGGILAMASYPSYNPGLYAQFDKSLYQNPTVAHSYEPGSTFKVLVMAAALNERVVTPTTTMNENGPVAVGDYAIRTWNDQYSGIQTMTEVIQHSSNVGMVFVERKLGKANMLRYIHAFGFGRSTGIDLEDEAVPGIRPDSQWGEIDFATASFGQGIAVTPIQMVKAVGAIANDGWLMEPHMVKSITDDNGKTVLIPPKRIAQIVSKNASDLVTEMMINSVENGEAKWTKLKGYRVAGKTGTAQIPVAGHYDPTKTIASFVGFAPADNPQFVMLVTLGEPKTSQWGSETAAPLFFAIAKDIFMYKGIPPTSQ